MTFRDALGNFRDLQGPLGSLGYPLGSFGTLQVPFRIFGVGILQGFFKDLQGSSGLWCFGALDCRGSQLKAYVSLAYSAIIKNPNGQAESLEDAQLVSESSRTFRDLWDPFRDLQGPSGRFRDL